MLCPVFTKNINTFGFMAYFDRETALTFKFLWPESAGAGTERFVTIGAGSFFVG